MKKLFFTLSILLALPFTAFAASYNVNLFATSTTQGWIIPNTINGNYQTIAAQNFTATATSASLPSWFPYFSFINATGTNATTTNFFATNGTFTTASTTNFYSAGLVGCSGATNALTWSSGSFGCNTITGGTGTVTSVGLSTPNSTLTLGGTNPVTTTGTISADLNLANQNIWTAASTTFAGGVTVLTSTTTSATTTTASFTNASTTNLVVSSAGTQTGCAQFSATGAISNTGSPCASSGGTQQVFTFSTTSLEQLATTTLSLASSSPALNGYDNLQVQISIPNIVGTASTTASLIMTFNGDSGVNYGESGMFLGTNNSQFPTESYVFLQQSASAGMGAAFTAIHRYIKLNIMNATTTSKMGSYQGGTNATTSSAVETGDMQVGSFIWANSTSRITQINLTTTSNNNTYLATGTEMTVQAY